MLSPVVKPWAGVTRDWRLFRTDEQIPHGIGEKPIQQVMPTPGIIAIIVTIPNDSPLLAKHVAHRVAALLAEERSREWREVDRVLSGAVDTLASAHGLTKRERHHVAAAHTGRFAAHPSHVVEDLFAEYLLTGNVALHDSGGAVRVDDGHRKYTAYAQPGHKQESKKTLEHLFGHFALSAKPLLDSLEGKILVV